MLSASYDSKTKTIPFEILSPTWSVTQKAAARHVKLIQSLPVATST